MLEWIISSAVLLAAVIAVRYALRGRLRPGVQYAMWAIVLVRLLVPVSFGSGAYSAGTAAAALEQTPAVQAVLISICSHSSRGPGEKNGHCMTKEPFEKNDFVIPEAVIGNPVL